MVYLDRLADADTLMPCYWKQGKNQQCKSPGRFSWDIHKLSHEHLWFHLELISVASLGMNLLSITQQETEERPTSEF